MPTRLDPLILTELSLVDEPANKDSRVTIFKRRDPDRPSGKEPTMTKNFEELASDIRKSENCSRTEALTLARQRHPEAFVRFQGEGRELEKQARARPEPLNMARAL